MLHYQDGERIIIDVVRSRAPKFNPDSLTAEYCDLLRDYRIRKVSGDKFSGDWALHSFQSQGITYQRAEKKKSDYYIEAEAAFNTDQVEIPNREAGISQLKSLVRKVHSGGRDLVDTDSGQPEDEANVIASLIGTLGKGNTPAVFIGVTKRTFYGSAAEGSRGSILSRDDVADYFEKHGQ